MSKKRKKLIKENRRGHTKNDSIYDMPRSLSTQEPVKKKSKQERFLRDYIKAVRSREIRPFRLKFFGKKQLDPRDLAMYSYDIEAANFFCNPNNLEKLKYIADQRLIEEFGPDALTRYGVSNSYKKKDLPDPKYNREPEEYVFTYDDLQMALMIFAKKYFLEDWKVKVNNRNEKIESRRFLMRVNGEVIVGELIKETQKAYNHVVTNARSGIRMAGFYRGLKEGYFIIDRCDYQPLSQHYNKLDENGNFCPAGVLKKHTKLSHRHYYNLQNRLFLTQNQSPDIIPTPLNEHRLDTEEELAYNSFEHMFEVYSSWARFQPNMIPEQEIERRGIKKVGVMYCENFTLEKLIELMEQREKARLNEFKQYTPPTVEILPNDDLTKAETTFVGHVRRELIKKHTEVELLDTLQVINLDDDLAVQDEDVASVTPTTLVEPSLQPKTPKPKEQGEDEW